MRYRIIAILLFLIVCAPIPTQTVLAATHYDLTLTPIDFGSVAPFTPQYLSFASPTAWTIAYRGSAPATGQLVGVYAEPVTDFAANFPATRIEFWDGQGDPSDPTYQALQYGQQTSVCYMLDVSKRVDTAIPVYMRLNVTGAEDPGSYTATIRVTAYEIP